MKEQKLTKFKVVFQETTVKNYTYNILAESQEDAVKRIESSCVNNSGETVSVELVILNK